MADPKYADLPGIARNEPDVYETSDLPEDDQAEFDAPQPQLTFSHLMNHCNDTTSSPCHQTSKTLAESVPLKGSSVLST